MRQAEEALAHTETVLKTRKDALMAKHVEGRESVHELDYIFRRREEADERQKPESNFNLIQSNYLNHDDEQDVQDALEEAEAEHENRMEEPAKKNKRPTGSSLFEWN